MTTTTHPAVTEYVARIQAALADLPAAEVEEIVEDIGQHLSEVAGELGDEISVETLTERLGTPEQYASELRAAAGYPPASGGSPARSGVFTARVALWGLVVGVLVEFLAGAIAGAMKDSNALGGTLPLSLPLLVAIVLVLSGTASIPTIVTLREYRAVADLWRRLLGKLPDSVATYLRSLRPAWWLIRIAILVTATLLALRRSETGEFVLPPLLAIGLLLWFGKRARTDRRWWWIVAPANVFALGVGLALLSWAWSDRGDGYSVVNYAPSMTNVYVFGPDGKPLPEVYLYDQNGQPITVWGARCDGSSGLTNKFPVPNITYDSTGCHEFTGVPFTVAIPRPSGPPSAPPTTTTEPPPSSPPTSLPPSSPPTSPPPSK